IESTNADNTALRRQAGTQAIAKEPEHWRSITAGCALRGAKSAWRVAVSADSSAVNGTACRGNGFGRSASRRAQIAQAESGDKQRDDKTATARGNEGGQADSPRRGRGAGPVRPVFKAQPEDARHDQA